MAAGVTEIFSDGCPGKRCEVLQCSRVGSRSGYDHRVVHGTFFTQRVDDVGHGGAFLPDGHIDAVHRFARLVCGTLVDDGVDGYRGLPRLAVADDQFALSPSDGNHGVDGLDACLQRFRYRLAVNDSGSFAFQRHFEKFPSYGASSVQRNAQRVDDAPQHVLADPYGGDASRTFHNHALFDEVGGS